MKITIFGANGGTGRLLTERCLAAGYEVTVLLRTPAKFPYRDRVTVVEGNAFESSSVRKAVEGADVVLSALGAHSPIRNENVLPRAVPLIVEAMRQAGVRRIIALGSAGALPDSLSKQPAWRRWFAENIVYTLFLKWPVAEQVSQYKTLSRSDRDWTMVMPPMLTNAPARGNYRVDGEALPRNASRISRKDVADFMMNQIGNPQWVRRGVYISY
jgi:putative NADH-flavin reductase